MPPAIPNYDLGILITINICIGLITALGMMAGLWFMSRDMRAITASSERVAGIAERLDARLRRQYADIDRELQNINERSGGSIRGSWRHVAPSIASHAQAMPYTIKITYWDRLLAELPPHHNGGVLCKAPLPCVGLERPCPAQVLAGVLHNQAPHCRGALIWRLRVGHPRLDDLAQMTRGDMLHL